MIAISMTLATLTSGSIGMNVSIAEAASIIDRDKAIATGASILMNLFGLGKKSDSGNSSSGNKESGTMGGYQKHSKRNMNNDEKLFMLAVSQGNYYEIEKMLNKGVDIDGVYNTSYAGGSGSGETALYYALVKNKRDMQQYLLEHGANPNGFYRYDNEFVSYIVMAAGDYELTKYLHDWGASINCVGRMGNHTALNFKDYNAITGIGGRNYDKNYNLIEYLLVEGIDTKYCNPYLTAVACGQPKTAILLAAYGADINATDEKGRTALTIALDESNYEMVKVVQEINARGQQPATYYLEAKAKEEVARQEKKIQEKAKAQAALDKKDKIDAYEAVAKSLKELTSEEAKIIDKYINKFKDNPSKQKELSEKYNDEMNKFREKYISKMALVNFPGIKKFGDTNQKRFRDMYTTYLEIIDIHSRYLDVQNSDEADGLVEIVKEKLEKYAELDGAINKDLKLN